MLGAVAAVAAVVALGIGLWGANVSSKLDDTRSALERSEAAAAVLADPGAQTVGLQAGEGRLVVGADGQAVLVVDGLDRAPAGKTYEMWILPDGSIEEANPAGLFPGRDGTEIVALDGHGAGRRPRRGNGRAVGRRGLADDRSDRRIGHRLNRPFAGDSGSRS